jgi:Baseplate J-like protein
MEQIIYLEADDDIPAIRDRLEWAQADRVLLVVPSKNHVLRSLVNLKLLARHAHNQSAKVALVTGDPHIIELSGEAHLATFGSVEGAQRSRWFSSQEVEKVRPRRKPVVEDVPGIDLPERPVKKVPRLKRWPTFSPRLRERISRPWTLRWALQIVGLLVLLFLVAGMMAAAVVLIYPEGQVQVTAATQSLSADIVVRANPDAERIDYAALDIPARLVQVEITDMGSIVPGTTSDQPVDKAQGVVSFINRTNLEITIPPSTTVSTSSGTTVRFLTVETTTIPAAFNAVTQTAVIAMDPGPGGNVPTGQINRVTDPALARQVTVINEAPTTGGSVKPAGIVSRADKDRLQAIVLQQIQQEGYSRLQQDLAEQEFIPPESLIVIPLDAVYDPSMDGEVTDKLSLEMRAVVRGTAIGGQNANQLALAALQAKVPADFRLDPRSLEFVAGKVGKVENRMVSFEVHASGVAIAQIDGREVAGSVRGLPVEEAQRVLHQRFAVAGEPTVVVKPDWLDRLPWFSFRIAVDVAE